MTMNIDDLIDRVSAPAGAFTEVAPTPQERGKILQAGMSAPDHGNLTPWRFVVVEGAARESLADLFASALRAGDPAASDVAMAAARSKPLRAPLIIIVVATPTAGVVVPEDEQLLAAGACAHQIVLAAGALDYGAVWLSGPYSSHPVVRAGLGVAAEEKIVGMIYIGQIDDRALQIKRAAVSRQDAAARTVNWTGPAGE